MIAKKVAYATDLLSDDSVKIFDYFFELAKEKGNKGPVGPIGPMGPIGPIIGILLPCDGLLKGLFVV